MMKVKIAALSMREHFTNLKVLQAWLFSLVFILLSSATGASESIYVRLNSNPFNAPYYIFSSTENGPSETIQLLKGSTYVFIRTDSGHAFNIGSAWRTANSEIISSSTASRYVVSGVGSIQDGEQLTITVPADFSGTIVRYYCFPHSNMVSNFMVVGGLDTDNDGILDSTDVDDDDDGFDDASDAFPLNASEAVDTDGDGVGNNSDSDDDGDDVNDSLDAFPLDSSEALDTDSDGLGNNADIDDDGDGLTDTQEATYGTNPLLKDSDRDGFSDYDEIADGTDPLDANSTPMGGLSLTLIKAFLDKQRTE